MARVKFKFSKNYVHGNKTVDKKGSTRLVTARAAKFLEANKFGTIAEAKEDKDADKRDTK